ncbi:preprotein translocase subunit YajC [Treponema endosymbiont of Eucomonympha sp.]|uniref:preprotein translocase subunit YajC n=1 Tax=Treponema endosymbiont of Eucomonympha sp. TaxID=1580831 RepID=UPI00078144CA|nr:preprotein translocase subunit YajC [Treponema endosymbiont of Eucomonympha sp.]
MIFIPFLQSGSVAPRSSNMLMTIAPFGLIILIFYFFIIRPQNKKQKETDKMISALKKGDKVVTIGGIHGVISSAHDQSVVVKVDDNTKIEFNRSAISSVVADKPVASKAEKKGKKKALVTEKISDAGTDSGETKPDATE